MLYLGIILGLVTALLMAIDTYMNKELMNNTSPLLHSGYRILFVIPYLLIAALFNWNFNIKCIYMLLIYGVNEVINIIFHQKAINKLNIVHDEMLSKSNVLFIYLISLLLYEGSFNTYGLLSIILFTLGMIFTIDFKSLKIIKKVRISTNFIFNL